MYLDYDLTFRIQRYEYASHVTTTPRVDPSETGRPRAGDPSRLTRARRGFDRSIDRSDDDEDDDEDEDVRARDAIEVRDAMPTL